ncbi:protein rep [Metabacillus fastidiosus]|uniref:protein rep n=1 Tax=Metabacillus fastidiosus TaxID=1458 RepID=UPI003D2E2336
MFIENRITDLEKIDNTGEVLSDPKSSGKERPWKNHRVESLKLAKSYRRLGMIKKAERVSECASFLKFMECPKGHTKRLTWANFCRVRLCSMCTWRKSLLVSHQVRLVTHEANKREKLRWLFLTLTVQNIEGENLSVELGKMMKAWQRFSQRKAFSKNVVGWFRALEITRNNDKKSEWYDTYHPHFHVLIAVKPSYFKGGNYLSQKEWTSLWQKSMQVDYTPIVHVQAVKNKRNIEKENQILEKQSEVEALNKAVLETAKYPLKSADFLLDDEKATDSAVSVLDSAMDRRRLLAYGGLLKEIWVELQNADKVQDVEDEDVDMVHVDGTPKECKCSTCGSNMLEHLYSWNIGTRNYIG